MKTMKLVIIFYGCQFLMYLAACADSTSQHDKHVIKEEPHSPSTSKQSSPRRVWEDKQAIVEQVSVPASTKQAHGSPSSSPTRVAHMLRHESQIHTGPNSQQVAGTHTNHRASHIQGPQPESQPAPSSPQSSHGSPIHEDIRQRLRSSRRPRSPQDNDASRAAENIETFHKSRHRRPNRRRLL